MISLRRRSLEETSLRPWGLKEQHFQGVRESGHLPPTLFLGEPSTGSCIWSRSGPGKKPAARLQTPLDRCDTAARWGGTSLIVALGGPVAVPHCGLGNHGPRVRHLSPSPFTHLAPQLLPPKGCCNFAAEIHSIFFAVPISTQPPAPALILLFSVSVWFYTVGLIASFGSNKTSLLL